MQTLLYLKANPKPDRESRTFAISETFIDAYRKAHPQDKVTTLDLYHEKVQPLTLQEVMMTHKNAGENHRTLEYARQFRDADKYVLAAPLWNLGIPSILKAYIDYVMIVGITFRYTEQGPQGLCTGKKALHITTRGGNYSEGPYAAYEMGDRYLRTILGFLGICEITTVAAEGLDVIGADVTGLVEAAKQKAVRLATSF